MEIKKTVGQAGLGGKRKDYVIHTKCGEKFYAKAVGSQGYEIGGINFGSIKALKAAIVAGDFFGFVDDDSEASEVSTADGADSWDCAHPCAFLAHLYDLGLLGDLGHKHKRLLPLFKDMMDSYGWNDDNGRPDVTRAVREIERVENLKGGN